LKKIAYYITTHGFGHATRSVAIIRELIKNPNFEIHICSSFNKSILQKWFQSDRIKFHQVETLFGVHYKDLIQVDLNKSINIFRNGIQKQNRYIEQELDYSRKNNIDMIISDICPFPFDVADVLKIPAIAISNFNWYSIFKHIIKQFCSSELKEDIEILKQSYEKSEILLQLPFSIEMDCFKKIKEISLVVRKLTRNKQEIRDLLKIEKVDPLIFFGLTDFKFLANKLIGQFNKLKEINKKIKILFSSFLKPFIPPADYFRYIPDDDQESHDFLAASDVVIGKTGYGTVSECVAYKRPLIYTTRKNFIEDIALSDGIERYGRGKYYPPEVLLNGEFENLLSVIQELKEKSVKEKISNKGTFEIFQFVNEFF